MSSTVRVKSNICAKTSKITVTMNDEGSFDVSIKSDCENIKNYAPGISVLSMDDLVDKNQSIVIKNYQNTSMSANCMVPSAVLSAAWMEAGLISKSRAKAVQNSTIEYLVDE